MKWIPARRRYEPLAFPGTSLVAKGASIESQRDCKREDGIDRTTSSSEIEARALTEEEAKCVFYDLVTAVRQLHAIYIAHQDIKPDNILIRQDGTAILCDFGVARLFSDEAHSVTSDSAGTSHYFSPEMCCGQSVSAFSNDLWAMGVTLFALVTGQLPWTSDSQAELLHRIGHDDLVFPSRPLLSEELQDLIRGILRKDRSERLTLEGISNHPWMGVL